MTAAAIAEDDPLWRMPLWAPYDDALSSDVADLKNDADAWAQAGSVTAALFLQRFAPASGAWMHLDIFAWNGRPRPGFPRGRRGAGDPRSLRRPEGPLRRLSRNRATPEMTGRAGARVDSPCFDGDIRRHPFTGA